MIYVLIFYIVQMQHNARFCLDFILQKNKTSDFKLKHKMPQIKVNSVGVIPKLL